PRPGPSEHDLVPDRAVELLVVVARHPPFTRRELDHGIPLLQLPPRRSPSPRDGHPLCPHCDRPRSSALPLQRAPRFALLAGAAVSSGRVWAGFWRPGLFEYLGPAHVWLSRDSSSLPPQPERRALARRSLVDQRRVSCSGGCRCRGRLSALLPELPQPGQ